MQNILQFLAPYPGHRIAYHANCVEIIPPVAEHEYWKEVVSVAISDLAEALEIPCESYGSTTWLYPAKQVVIEADNCFYLQRASQICGKLEFDLTVDPPPDLALKIDLTSPSLDRFPIYARLGVPEIWRYANGQLQVYERQGDHYHLRTTSIAFPNLPVGELMPLIEQYRLVGRLALRRAVRDWAAQWRSPQA